MKPEGREKNGFHDQPVRYFLIFTSLIWSIGQHIDAEECRFIVNSRNERIDICKPVRRIAVLPTDALEVIRILDLTEMVVGVNNSISEKGLYWPELKDRPKIGHPFEPNYEQIVSLWPDIVIAYGGLRPGPELENKLTPLGIKVLRMDFYRMSAIVREITAFGELTGRKKEAGVYGAWHDKWLSYLDERLESVHHAPPKVYLEGYSDFKASGPGSEGYEMGLRAGGRLIHTDRQIPNPLISTEVVVDWNPDIIVKLVSGEHPYVDNSPCPLSDMRKRIMTRPGWSYISAVKTGRVYMLSSDIGPGPRGIIGVLYMAKFFYPDIFKDLDVRDVHQEYMEQFQGVPYRGVYAYPENITGSETNYHYPK